MTEATEGLAPLIVAEIWRVIGLVRATGLSTLIVDRDWRRVLAHTDRAVVLEKGRVVLEGPSDALARDTLAEPGVVLIALSARLADKGSDYAPVFALLCDIAGLEMDEEAARALPPAEDPETLEELDAQWEEEEIRFTADATPDPTAACPQVSAILDRMREPATATIANRRN